MIDVSHVSKTYRSVLRGRTVHAVRDLSLTVAAGEVFGIAGPNGAGKTTLLAVLLGFLRPDGGSVRIAGDVPRTFVERHGVCYLSELVDIPGWWSVRGAIDRYALLTGIPGHARPAAVRDAIERLGLGEHRAKRIKQLSKGNRQRVGLAQALLGDSPVVILDEPTHGLDPLWTQRFRDIVATLRRPDRAIVIASHNLDELERLADRVAILDHGALSRLVDGGEAPAAGALAYRLVLEADHAAVSASFPTARRTASSRDVSFDVEGTIEELNAGLRALLASGAVVRAFYPARSRLEESFRQAVEQS
ncbi:MAG TPA: ABC transporter ATP-binding protein [Gemmatimonadales bacterium]|nr:ABC transporter ATP-binding protein [Gemmatimonadales bacterium]